MKYYKAFTIFYSKTYRIILGLLLLLKFVIDVVLRYLISSDLTVFLSTIFIALMGVVPLYGDLAVFAGLHSKEGGQIGCCQASFYGDSVIKTGVLADRFVVFLWLLACSLLQMTTTTINEASAGSIASIFEGFLLIYTIVTISVNINRFLLTTQEIMFAVFIESAICGLISVTFFILGFQITIALIVGIILAIGVTFATVKIAGHYIKRSYYDE